MIRRPPRSTRIDTLFPYSTCCRSERAAFLLHGVFGQSFDEIAAVIGRDPAACRQLAARARAHVRAERPRYPVERAHGQEIAAAFLTASRAGDTDALRALLADRKSTRLNSSH